MPDSGTDYRDHFIKQRRNLVLLCVAIFLFKLQTENLNITSFQIFKTLDENSFYAALAIFLISLIYLSLRYYQAMIKDRGYSQINQDYENLRDRYLIKKEILVDRIYEGRRDSEQPQDWPDDDYYIPPKIRVSINSDWGNEIALEKKINHQWTSPTFLVRKFLRIKIFFYSLIPLTTCLLRERALLEYAFPLLFSFFAFLEIFGLNISKNIVFGLGAVIKNINSY